MNRNNADNEAPGRLGEGEQTVNRPVGNSVVALLMSSGSGQHR